MLSSKGRDPLIDKKIGELFFPESYEDILNVRKVIKKDDHTELSLDLLHIEESTESTEASSTK